MADQQQQQAQAPQQYSQVYTLVVDPGVKRDGTIFESKECTDGVWNRFQRGRPKKIGGYTQLFATFNGVPRGMVMNSYNGVNYVFAGNQNGLDVFATGQNFGSGAGPFSALLEAGYSKFAVANNTSNTFTISYTASNGNAQSLTSVFNTGATVIFNQNTNPVTYSVSTSSYNNVSNTTTVTLTTPIAGGANSVSNVWLDNVSFAPSANLLWQFDYQYNVQGGTLNLLAHPGLNLANIDNGTPSPVYVGSTVPNSSNQWTFTVLADTSGTSPTFQPISVNGGVCVLHPFIFVYGENGYIANNHVSSVYNNQVLTDWNGPLANQVNLAAGKIVKGMPIRGGTVAPSGLFWATDSLIRVSFVNNPPTYWQYDIVSSEISIMSSSAVVEMDGAYYWMGVDRFYVYNGVVQVLPNDKNVNWLFNNLNFTQRQKVWATKVPRYNEIWFFYPRGTNTECTDAIIYNTKDKIWYDAGQAEGAQRSSGYTTEVFPTPIWGDWNYNVSYSRAYTVSATPSGQSAPTTSQFYTLGDVTTTFVPGSYVTFSNSNTAAAKYQINTSVHIFNTTLEATGGVTLITVNGPIVGGSPAANTAFYAISGGYAIWQHEVGLNKVSFTTESAIPASFTTCDLSWVGGSPSGQGTPGVNRRMHLRRIEPDFVQGGNLTMNIIGKPFANGPISNSGPYTITTSTDKIDLRVENRENRLQFASNEVDGNYEMGRLLVTAEFGDERP